MRLFIKEQASDWLPDLDVVLLALILCMNINKYFLGSNEYLFYSIFLLFLIVSVFKNPGVFYVHIKNRHLWGSAILLCVSALIGSVALGFTSLVSAVKLVVTLIIAYCASKFSTENIKKTLAVVVVYTLFYSVILWSHTGRADWQTDTATQNYLNLTTVLGGVFSILLCRLLLIIYGFTPPKSVIPTVGGIVLILLGLSKFTGRGPILLPVITACCIFLILAPMKPLKLYAVILAFAIVGVLVYSVFLRNVSTYFLERMERLFKNPESELRVSLWSRYIKEILNRHWYFIGGGAEASRIKLGYYPHNLYLQLIGEFGIIGILFGIVTTFLGVQNTLRFRAYVLWSRSSANTENEETVFLCFSVMLYYFLTFMKSFSLFDAYPLFILYAFMLSSISETLSKKQYKKQFYDRTIKRRKENI